MKTRKNRDAFDKLFLSQIHLLIRKNAHIKSIEDFAKHIDCPLDVVEKRFANLKEVTQKDGFAGITFQLLKTKSEQEIIALLDEKDIYQTPCDKKIVGKKRKSPTPNVSCVEIIDFTNMSSPLKKLRNEYYSVEESAPGSPNPLLLSPNTPLYHQIAAQVREDSRKEESKTNTDSSYFPMTGNFPMIGQGWGTPRLFKQYFSSQNPEYVNTQFKKFSKQG